jgi:hypothetical protein
MRRKKWPKVELALTAASLHFKAVGAVSDDEIYTDGLKI